MANRKNLTRARIGVFTGAGPVTARQQAEEALLQGGGPAERDFQQRQLLEHRQ